MPRPKRGGNCPSVKAEEEGNPDPVAGKATYECDACDFKCRRKGGLKKHKEGVHEKTKDFMCGRCSYSIHAKDKLKRHAEIVHEKKKNFECPHCEYTSYTRQQMTKHVEAVHEKRVKFSCDLCDFRCYEKGTLKKHGEAVHEGKKNFSCDECGYGSFRRAAVERHVDAVHLGLRRHVCGDCGRAFAQRPKLVDHVKKVHGGGSARPFALEKKSRHACQVCVVGFHTIGAFRAHLKTHRDQIAHDQSGGQVLAAVGDAGGEDEGRGHASGDPLGDGAEGVDQVWLKEEAEEDVEEVEGDDEEIGDFTLHYSDSDSE